MLIRSYRVRGHLEAKLDPLGLEKREHHPELDPATYGFGEADWDRPIFLNGVLGLDGDRLIAQLGEELPPALVDGARILQPAGIELGDEARIGAGEERGGIDLRHC